MLKALELIGFKSFANKTRFEFPEGITVVVGPNGSGKSNIVDAIKWVLGEQSAKSLRGQEMADVIFKGSGSGGRKAMNTAEATLVFDNSTGILGVDPVDVRVTRRVYRSGEGEYLINGQPSRLRDIRDLFRGTGAGADAYSLIEQGKVDVLLSASARERRAIFEEAAGISRFKAKKVEAARRLERVEQNMLRLSDIVEEVEIRLRGVKSQAGKARRYKEYTERLQDLRTHVGNVEWQQLSVQIDEIKARHMALQDRSRVTESEAESLESRVLELETEAEVISEQSHNCEAKIAIRRERIATRELAVRHEFRRMRELNETLIRSRRQFATMSTRADDLTSQFTDTSVQFQRAEAVHLEASRCLRECERSWSNISDQLQRVRKQTDELRSQQMEFLNKNAALTKEHSAAESQMTALVEAKEKIGQQLDRLHSMLQEQTVKVRGLRETEPELAEQADQLKNQVSQLRGQMSQQRKFRKSAREHQFKVQADCTSCGERIAVLEELEQRREGLDAGVKHVLSTAQDSVSGPYSDVVGLVADLLQVNVEYAPLVEVGLGDIAHYVVLSGESLLDEIRSGMHLPGRVGFILAEGPLLAPSLKRIQLGGQPGVLGRADQFVGPDRPLSGIVNHLLGNTWFVETLQDAIDLWQRSHGGVRFVTRGGELLDSDGTLVVGSQQSTSGLISRRSELRALRVKLTELDRTRKSADQETSRLERVIADLEQRIRKLEEQHKDCARHLAEYRVSLQAAQERHDLLHGQHQAIQGDFDRSTADLQESNLRRRMLQEQLFQADQQLEEVNLNLANTSKQFEQSEVEQRAKSVEVTAAKVEMAKCEQRLEGLRAAMKQFQRDREEREKALRDSQIQIVNVENHYQQANIDALALNSELALLYLQKDELANESVQLNARREQAGKGRSEASQKAQLARRQLRGLQDSVRQAELQMSQTSHERTVLEERLRDEYGIELSMLSQRPSASETRQRVEMNTEISELRRKINNIGAVNMQALDELEQLQSRFNLLSEQHRDLTAAKDSLEKIIRKINADSRRLFTETLEAIRGNFQTLFRKTFGGGRADIQLEDDVDILESGIEIVATPPGKNSLGLSLLSGGERALTAVTLLLAIFQYRPSPFCVLDEVDGPLDEANIERFTNVLKEFLNWTKFVVVTHSKKTMTSATTLYGVTMQESGISKRVAVQFDDVAEDGHIRQDVLDESEETSEGEDERGAA
ncbi:MAG: chromosome segregation protein SMC [Planctomycetaceae bacterium]|nr:chromosome segregation protein SMC [Planctomycetaceae bacterium]